MAYYPFNYYRYYWMPLGYGRLRSLYGYQPRTTEVTEGTLVIDILDAKSKELVWRGSVSSNLYNSKNLHKQIEKGVKAIMKKYPVKQLDSPSDVLPKKDDVS
jgi:hypothetical protein